MGNKQNNTEREYHLYENIKLEGDSTFYKFQQDKLPIIETSEIIKQKAFEIEAEILKMSQLVLNEQIWSEDIPIDFYGDNYLHTIRAQSSKTFLDKTKPTLIFIHGYQACSANYVKMLKIFYQDYNVYVPDLIGMGISSRPQPEFTDPKDYINFFVDSIEAFRLSIFKEYSKWDNKQIILVGHSLGGYFAANYSIKYQKFVRKLILLSPAGITDNKKGNVTNNVPIGNRLGFSFIETLWLFKLTLQDMSNKFIFENLLESGLKKRYKLSEEENEMMAKFTKHSLTYPRDLDHVMYHIFEIPIPSLKFPLEDILFQSIKNFTIDFIFGSDDWMDTDGTLRLCERDGFNRFKIFWLFNARHSFVIENSERCGKLILERLNQEKIV